ncbi:MAG: hypothetical protein ABIC68_02630 [Candidatus Omnitrophota bacterium]
MVEVCIEKESENEYTVSADHYDIGTYYTGEGIVLVSSEGSAIPLETLKQAIAEMESII